MSAIDLSIEAINKLEPLEIVKAPAVKEKFISIYSTFNGYGETAYERESAYFNNILRADEKLQKATKFSIFQAFIELAVCGLSLEPTTHALCYLQGRNVKIGEKTDEQGKKKAIYEGHLVLTISGYGELVRRINCGQIKHVDNPVIVYEEDNFSFTDDNNTKQVKYQCNLPHKSNKVVACFVRITRNDDSIDYGVMLEEDWARLKEFSAKNNRKWDDASKTYKTSPNPLYQSRDGMIDIGFLKAKCIKHAFSTYPRIPIGRNTMLESEQDDFNEQLDDVYADMPTEPKDFTPAIAIGVNNTAVASEDNDDTF